MSLSGRQWMEYSIDVSMKSPQSVLRVGAVLVSEKDELICSAFSGEGEDVSWLPILLRKVRALKTASAQSFYITINTLSDEHLFDLNRFLDEVRVNKVYVGLPDPSLTYYCDRDPVITFGNVSRYSDDLQWEILERNSFYYKDCKQSIKYSPYYYGNRISELVIENLKLKGFAISGKDLNANKRKSALAALLCNQYELLYEDALDVAHNAISEAFNSKYGAYDYSDDIRSLDLSWKENFWYVYEKVSTKSLPNLNILNVGVGSGYEAIALFSNCSHATFVDISQCGLETIKKQNPLSKIIVSNADNLSSVKDSSQDFYVSLRTYNSSFFDIKKSILEARRVLKTDSIILISIANGFLCTELLCIIPGLILPGTEFVDIYRGMDIAKLIYTELISAGFENIQIFPTNTEIYLSAINSK